MIAKIVETYYNWKRDHFRLGTTKASWRKWWKPVAVFRYNQCFRIALRLRFDRMLILQLKAARYQEPTVIPSGTSMVADEVRRLAGAADIFWWLRR